MHVQDSATARVMRRASTGPHALMSRRALQPYVPDRGSSARLPFRRVSGLTQDASAAAAGYKAGTAAATLTSSIGSSIGAGAAAGSFAPIIGTAIGVIVALVASGVFEHRVDPEVGNFNNAVTLYNQQGATGILNIADKYLVLAGLFDLEPGQIKGNIPIYKKYGRLGEQRFTQDMANLVYNAAQTGQITENDTVASVWSRIVLPWINGFGFGSMQDVNGDMINTILQGMIAEYVTGLWSHRWFARSGDMPNWQIQPFSLPGSINAPAQSAVTASPTPSLIATVPTVAAPQLPAELQSYYSGHRPNPGDPVSYAYNGAGYVAVPSGGTFYGTQLPNGNGAWILTYSGQQYVLQGTTLNPYSTPQTQVVVSSQKTILPIVSPDTSGGTTIQALPALPQQVSTAPTSYVSSGGGGIFPVSQPVASALPSSVASLTPMEWLAIGGGALFLILLLKRPRGEL